MKAVLQRIAAESLTKYPERQHVERIAASHFGLSPEAVLLTNGVDEAIHLVCETYLEPQDEVIIVTPTFSMYALYAEATGASVRAVQADNTLQFPYRRVRDAIQPATRLIMVASPNNPTGAVVESSLLLELAAAAPQAALLVDEAYYHFHGQSLLSVTATVSKTAGSADILESLWACRVANRPSGRPSRSNAVHSQGKFSVQCELDCPGMPTGNACRRSVCLVVCQSGASKPNCRRER